MLKCLSLKYYPGRDTKTGSDWQRVCHWFHWWCRDNIHYPSTNFWSTNCHCQAQETSSVSRSKARYSHISNEYHKIASNVHNYICRLNGYFRLFNSQSFNGGLFRNFLDILMESFLRCLPPADMRYLVMTRCHDFWEQSSGELIMLLKLKCHVNTEYFSWMCNSKHLEAP